MGITITTGTIMTTITFRSGTAANRLLFAINHYVSTGDHIGEGIVAPIGGDRFLIPIPVNRTLSADQADFACFRSRFNELAPDYGTQLEYAGGNGVFDFWHFSIRADQMDALAADLRARPGPKGWGSEKAKIEAVEWRACDTIGERSAS